MIPAVAVAFGEIPSAMERVGLGRVITDADHHVRTERADRGGALVNSALRTAHCARDVARLLADVVAALSGREGMQLVSHIDLGLPLQPGASRLVIYLGCRRHEPQGCDAVQRGCRALTRAPERKSSNRV